MATPATLAGPAYFAGSVGNIFTPTSGVYALVKLIHLCNTDTVNHYVTIYRGASGGSSGGEQIAAALAVPAGGLVQIPLYLEMPSNTYLTGLADAGSKVTYTIMGDQSVYPA